MTSPFASRTNSVLFIAEIGGNHEGDFSYARRLNGLAIKSGADVVKHQIYTGDSLVSAVESLQRNVHFKKFALSREQYVSLAEETIAADLMFMASVWDDDILEWIDPYLQIHKIGSGDATCWPMVRVLAQTSKPIVLSTGLSTLREIEATIRCIERVDADYVTDRKLALLQCTSAYPCPDEDVHLRAIETLRTEFRLPVGFSDHSIGTLAIEAAVAMGAEIIEKHFTDTREGKVFRDHKISITPEEMAELLPRLRRIATLRGQAAKALTGAEQKDEHQVSFRRSVYAARDIRAGEILTQENLTVLRPAVGIPANRIDDVMGRTARRPIARHEVLHDDDFV